MLDKVHIRIQEANYTKKEWEDSNPILLNGEKGFVSDDPNLFKLGDGVTPWNSLPWRGYTGTIAQVFGDNENAVISQKAVTARIEAEEKARKEADNAEAEARNIDINAEATARAEADTQLNNSIVEEATSRENADEIHDSRLLELEMSQWPLDATLVLSSELLEYTGEDQSVNATYSVKRRGELKKPNVLTLSKDGADLGVAVTENNTVPVTVNKLGITEFVLTASAHSYYGYHSEDESDIITDTDTKTVQMVLPIYAGFGTSYTDVMTDENKLSVRTSADGLYAKTSSEDDVNFYILVPATFPQLTLFTMGGAPFVMETSEITAGQFNKNYIQYKSGAIYNTGATVNIKAS